jgi:hypothetical protein
MDVNGAKALKRRLGADGAGEALPVVEPVEIPADAPPVYRWTGKTPAATASTETNESAPLRRASLLSRLSLSPR